MTTQKRLKELLKYDPDTGNWIWLVSRNQFSRAGMSAGGSSKDGYIRITIDGKKYLAHRLAFLYMEGKFPKEQVDHKKEPKTNNRWDNLRKCNQIQNMANRKLSKNNTSGYKGVSLDKNSWRAALQKDGKTWIGYFSTPELAAKAYNEKALELNGEFAYANI